MKPNGHVTSPSMICINTSDLRPHLDPNSLTHSSLSFHWFVQLLGIPFLSHVWQLERMTNFLGKLQAKILELLQGLTSVNQAL